MSQSKRNGFIAAAMGGDNKSSGGGRAGAAGYRAGHAAYKPKLYMAYNHNDIPLMRNPTVKNIAEREMRDYTFATGNAAYVKEV